jgi:hypothetical protein
MNDETYLPSKSNKHKNIFSWRLNGQWKKSRIWIRKSEVPGTDPRIRTKSHESGKLQLLPTSSQIIKITYWLDHLPGNNSTGFNGSGRGGNILQKHKQSSSRRVEVRHVVLQHQIWSDRIRKLCCQIRIWWQYPQNSYRYLLFANYASYLCREGFIFLPCNN